MCTPKGKKRTNMAKLLDSYPGNNPVIRDLDISGLDELEFGRPLKDAEFLLQSHIGFLNHGSYGAVPRRILEIQRQYNEERESHPDMWFRLNAKHYMDIARADVARFVGAHQDNILFVTNATFAVNTVVKSFPFAPGDAILDTTWTYGSVHLLCEDLTTRIRPDVEMVTLQLSFPLHSKDDVLRKYEDVLKTQPNIKMALIDHVTSPTSVVMPIKELTDLCHRYDVIVVIDGAHSLGQIDVNMEDIGADFFTSNLHKWCYCPRGAAMLYYNQRHADWLHPLVTSWHLGHELDQQFFDQGTRDHVPFICTRNALQFYNALGGMEKIVSYTTGLARKARHLFEELGLVYLDIPGEMEAPNMKLVKLPAFKDFPCLPENTWPLQLAIFGSSQTFGILAPIEGNFYFRYSLQAYTSVEDITAVVDIIRIFIHNNKA